MKKKLALLATPIVLLAASPSMATDLSWGVTPYVGVDAEIRHLNFQKGFGDNLFQHSYPQGNLYAGLRFNEYLALEGGYEATERKHRTNTLVPGTVSLGSPITALAGSGVKYNATTQIKALHADLMGTLPISDCYRLQLIGMVGMARLKVDIVRNLISVNGISVASNSLNTRKFAKRKSVLRLGLGVQHMINCNWGVRAMLKWENSKKLTLSNSDSPVSTLLVKFKNSSIYSIGAFYNF